MSFKVKNYILVFGLAVLYLLLFFYFFGLLDSSNEKTAQTVQTKNLALATAQAEQRSYQQAQKDLEALKLAPTQPQDFFSIDTHLVKEIQSLEGLAQQTGVTIAINVSGSAKAAQKLPKAASSIVVIPYTMTLTGEFDHVVAFIQGLQHTTFVTQAQSVALNALPKGQVRAVLSAQFYLKP